MKEVRRYAVRIHGGPQGSGEGSRATIHLFDKQKRMIGHISFMDESVTLLQDKSEDGVVYLSLPANQLRNVIDILRHERPLYVDWQPTMKNAYLGTSHEPVGEGESIGF